MSRLLVQSSLTSWIIQHDSSSVVVYIVTIIIVVLLFYHRAGGKNSQNRKVTDYFPIRRSSRKSKTELEVREKLQEPDERPSSGMSHMFCCQECLLTVLTGKFFQMECENVVINKMRSCLCLRTTTSHFTVRFFRDFSRFTCFIVANQERNLQA